MDSIAPTPQNTLTPTIPLEVSDEQNTALVEDTLLLLNDGLTSLQSQHGFSELSRWEEVLRASERPGLAKINQEMAALRELLAQENPDGHTVAEILASLGNETIKVADEASNGYSAALTHLGKVLLKLGSTLSR